MIARDHASLMTGVSFIVTVFDKAAFLPRVLDALQRQSGDFTREFLFIDDGSRDGSAEIIARLTEAWRDPVLILRQPNRGASAATNAGAERACLNR
jgi:glycosyltransferase involved in cell wall biosynthesis